MGKFRVTATFTEERLVEAETREEAEGEAWGYYVDKPLKLLEGLRVTVEEDLDNSKAAYQKLLAKAHYTADYCAGAALNMLSVDARVGLLMVQLDYLGVTGYSREQVSQLVKENIRNR